MMKASLNTRYETDHKDTISGGATVAFNVGDFKLRASMTDATIKKSDATIIASPTFNGLALAVEKPGSFSIGYDVPEKDFRFQFMSSIKVLEKPLNLNYFHSTRNKQTSLDGTLVFNSANKMSASHVMGSSGCKLKYSYVHAGLITFEPSYDTTKTYFDFALSRKVYKNDTVRATYKTNLYDIKDEALSGNLGLEWSRRFNQNASFKVSASLNLAEEHKMPKLSVESSWDFDM